MNKLRTVFFLCAFGILLQNSMAEDAGTTQHNGRYYASINDSRVNMRYEPNINGKIMMQLDKGTEVVLLGISYNTSIIDNQKFNWILVGIEEPRTYYDESGLHAIFKAGWVFGKYLIGAYPEIVQEIDLKSGVISCDTGRVDIRTRIFRIDKDLSGFVLDPGCPGYSFRNSPGLYIVRNNDNHVIQYIGYIGSGEYNKTVISQDGRYLFLNIGRWGLGWTFVFDLKKGTQVFQGTFLGDFTYDGNDKFQIVYSDNFDNVDSEIKQIKLDNEFLASKPDLPMQYIGYVFSYDLSTGTRQFIKAIWFRGQ